MATPTAPVDPNLPTPPAPKAGKPIRKGEAGVPIIGPRVNPDTLKPAGQLKLSRAGLGKLKPDGRRSGGQFSCKRLIILDVAQTTPEDWEATPEAGRLKLAGCRELRVPLHMDQTSYPTIQATEAVMEEYEEMYETEDARDRVLSMQVDPFNVNPMTGQPKALGFGRFDPAARGNSDPFAGKAWSGANAAPAAAVATVE